jgi:hypothetical protein
MSDRDETWNDNDWAVADVRAQVERDDPRPKTYIDADDICTLVRGGETIFTLWQLLSPEQRAEKQRELRELYHKLVDAAGLPEEYKNRREVPRRPEDENPRWPKTFIRIEDLEAVVRDGETIYTLTQLLTPEQQETLDEWWQSMRLDDDQGLAAAEAAAAEKERFYHDVLGYPRPAPFDPRTATIRTYRPRR